MDEKQEAIESFAGGMSIRDIAEELQVSIPTVYRWLADTDLINRFRLARNEAIIETYVETDISVSKILKGFDISHSTLYQILHKHDVPLRSELNKTNFLSDEEILKLYQSGEPILEIRRKSHRSNTYIYTLLKENKIYLRRPWDYSDFFS